MSMIQIRRQEYSTRSYTRSPISYVVKKDEVWARLPSGANLAELGDWERWSLLSTLARGLREELKLFDGDIIVAVDGVPAVQHRRNLSRRLDRVYRAANRFGHYVNQPGAIKPRVRVKARTRRIDVHTSAESRFAADGPPSGEDCSM